MEVDGRERKINQRKCGENETKSEINYIKKLLVCVVCVGKKSF